MPKKQVRPIRILKRGGERASDITRTTEAAAVHQDISIRVMRQLPKGLPFQVEHINSGGMFGSKATIHFNVDRRENAVKLMEYLKPQPLTFLACHRKRMVWCLLEPEPSRVQVVSREDIAPFTFSVYQGQNFGPNVKVSWATRLGDLTTTVEANIRKGPAYFTLERNDAQLPTMVRYMWVRSKGFPEHGAKFGSWGYWSATKDDPATCICYWPFKKLPTALAWRRDWNYVPAKMAGTVLLDPHGQWEGHNENPNMEGANTKCENSRQSGKRSQS